MLLSKEEQLFFKTIFPFIYSVPFLVTLYRVKLKLFDLTRYRIFLQIKVLECDAISFGKFRTYFQNSERSLSGEIGTFIPTLI